MGYFDNALSQISQINQNNAKIAGSVVETGKRLSTTGLNTDDSQNRLMQRYNISQGLLPTGEKKPTMSGQAIDLIKSIVAAPITGTIKFGENIGDTITNVIDSREMQRAQRENDAAMKSLVIRFHSGKINRSDYERELKKIEQRNQTIAQTAKNIQKGLPTTQEVIGNAATLGLDIATMGTLSKAKVGKSVVETVGKSYLKSAGTGAAIGGAYGAASAAGENKSFQDSIMSAGMGALTGGALGLIGTAVSRSLSKTPTEITSEIGDSVSSVGKKTMVKSEGGGVAILTKTAVPTVDEEKFAQNAFLSKLDSIKKARAQRAGVTSELRAQQAARSSAAYKEAIAKGYGPAKASRIAEKSLGIKGNYEKVDKIVFNRKEEDAMFKLARLNLRELEADRFTKAINNLAEGITPVPSDVEILAKGLGVKLRPNMLKEMGFKDNIRLGIEETGNLMRLFMTTGDISSIGRQNLIAIVRNPIKGAQITADSFKYLGKGGEEKARKFLKDVKSSPYWKTFKETGGEMQNIGVGESELMPTANSLPIVKQTERHFTMLGNELRWNRFMNYIKKYGSPEDAYEKELQGALKDGLTKSQAEKLASRAKKDLEEKLTLLQINTSAATGIGSLPQKLEKYRHELNATFFSPRLLFSRFHYLNPKNYRVFNANDAIRTASRETAKDMASLVGFSAAALMTAKSLGADVELDPRSSDFGKAKIGNTRFEITGGFTPYFRTFAQLVTGQRKSTNSGAISSTDSFGSSGRVGTAINFARGKLNPLAGTAVNIATGSNIVGEPTTFKSILQNSIPMVFADTLDELSSEDKNLLKALGIFAAGEVGVGTQTFGTQNQQDKTAAKKARIKEIKATGNIIDETKFRITGK